MIYSKRFYEKTLHKQGKRISVQGPVPTEELKGYQYHESMTAFRLPADQHQALIEISELPEARIIIALDLDLGMIVGYITFLHPDPLERWAQIPMPDLLELGAIEVAQPYRNLGLGKEMLQIAFMDDAMNDYIVLTTEYYWHWDLKSSGLDVWQYREMMEKLMGSAGLEVYATDDPEIICHSANCLMAKIGSRVPMESVEKFDQMRFSNRYLY